MCARAHAHAKTCPFASYPRHGISTPRQLAATHQTGGRMACIHLGSLPGLRLTAEWIKVNTKCRKVKKSLDGSGKFSIFAPDSQVTVTNSLNQNL